MDSTWTDIIKLDWYLLTRTRKVLPSDQKRWRGKERVRVRAEEKSPLMQKMDDVSSHKTFEAPFPSFTVGSEYAMKVWKIQQSDTDLLPLCNSQELKEFW